MKTLVSKVAKKSSSTEFAGTGQYYDQADLEDQPAMC